MNENRETANAETYPAILRLAGDIAPFDDAQGRLRQGGTFSVFFTKKIHNVNFFCEKDRSSTMLPQANRTFIGLTAWFEQPPRKSCK
jgi:hypothetical protein